MSEKNVKKGAAPMAKKAGNDEQHNGQMELKVPDTLPLLPVRDIVVFPYMILPLYVGRKISVKAINEALAGSRMMLLAAQKDPSVDDPAPKDIYSVGTVVTVIRMIKMEDERVKILVHGLAKAKIKKFIKQSPFLQVRVEHFRDEPDKNPKKIESEALIRSVKEQMAKITEVSKMVSPDILAVVEGLDEPGKLADLIASNLGLKVEDAQKILETAPPLKRLKKVNEILGHEMELLSIQEKIQTKTYDEMSKSQRDYYLREQMKQIQKELGDVDERMAEINEIREKLAKAKLPKEAAEEAEKQVNRLSKMHPDSAEATTARTYLEWVLDVPWSVSTRDNLNIPKARKILDEDHYDLDKIKDRILEFLGVMKLKKDQHGPILCFAGPPGVGKTSLGKSIARALGRKFVRISLGGVRDEAEIRGHRRTYIGAMPGKIIQGLKTAGSNNPVFMMDEIDKLGADWRGDPSSALLEVLDPEQNNAFSDHYLGVPFDLTGVMFITTANIIDTIPPPLRDRMEVIHLSGYTMEEKLGIAKKYIVARQMERHGITPKNITFSDKGLRALIDGYTREAGLRNLEREVANICRKVALKVAMKRKPVREKITEKSLPKYIGPVRFIREAEKEAPQVGVVNGLAWTQAGGEIMHIEVTTMKGKGALTITGKLGEVMRESAQAAYSYCRTNAKKLGIPENFKKNTDVHIHVPAGAIPKDGPSAGISIAVALASALSEKPVRNDIAMTGEITLRGKVLPIGGLKEKTLGALRAGIHTVIIPWQNLADTQDMPDYVKKNIKFIPVKTVDMVIKNSFKGKKKAARKKR